MELVLKNRIRRFLERASGIEQPTRSNAINLILLHHDESQLRRIIREMDKLDGSPSSNVAFVERILALRFIGANAEGAD